MGRKRELETVQIVVSALIHNQKDGITRKALIEAVEQEHKISERSIAEALSVLTEAELMRKTSEPFGARLRINLPEALRGYRDFQLTDLLTTAYGMPDRIKDDIHNSWERIDRAVISGEIDFIRHISHGTEYWPDYPEEASEWAMSLEIHWVMRYLKIWKSKQKTTDQFFSGGGNKQLVKNLLENQK